MVVVVGLIDPFLGMGAWPKAMEPEEPSNPPGAGPQIEKRRMGTEEGCAKGRGSRARKKKMGEVLLRMAAVRTARRRRSVDPKAIRRKEKRMAVAAKTGKSTTGRAGQGQLLSRHRRDTMRKVTEGDRRTPRRVKRVANECSVRRQRLRSRTVGRRESGSRLSQRVG